jgi:Protein of unknown function (DUF1194)
VLGAVAKATVLLIRDAGVQDGLVFGRQRCLLPVSPRLRLVERGLAWKPRHDEPVPLTSEVGVLRIVENLRLGRRHRGDRQRYGAERVDLLLVLAMDVSRSMDQAKFQLQRQGYAAAISNSQVLKAITSGPYQKIAICFIDWSGPFEQKLVIDWSIIDSPAAASRFADLIVEAPRSFYNSTSIGSAIDFAAAQIARAPFEAERHAIDVSGGAQHRPTDVNAFG